MDMHKIEKKLIIHAPDNINSALDLYKRIGAMAHKVKDRGKVASDSMLALYQERLTYTFILGTEVASIHYDQGRGEIFFKGQNIKHMDLDDQQQQALMDLGEVLRGERDARRFYHDYEATLANILADKR